MKTIIVALRTTAESRDRWQANAKAAGVSLSEWARRLLDGEPRVPFADRPKSPSVCEVPVDKTKRPGFKRSPKCVTEKCERLGPSCDLCRRANSVSF